MNRNTVAVLVCLGALALLAPQAEPCSNILVTKGATVDGSTMISYSADSHEFYGELALKPAGVYPPGAMRDVYEWDTGTFLGRIAQVPATYALVGNMNEHQVAVGETTYTGRKELEGPSGIVDYGSLMFIALERAKTAREAIQVIGEVVAEYGYASTGESFSISDPNEVWIFEIIGIGKDKKGAVWVARKLPDGTISGHANQARIRQFPLNEPGSCLYSPNVISFAREMGWFDGKDEEFSFADTYAPIDFAALRFCESRVWNVFRRVAPSLGLTPDYVDGSTALKRLPLWIKPDKKLAVQDVMSLMRDHFEGTPFDLTLGVGAGPYSCPYRWRPMEWKLGEETYVHERAISTQQTGFSFVAQSRGWLPGPIGGIFWFGVDDTYTTVYLPMYCGITQAPETYAVGAASFDAFSWKSAWWVFNFVANWAYSRYSDMIVDIKAVQGELEAKLQADVPEVDRTALKLLETSPRMARDYLTDYCMKQGDMVTERWRSLGEFLIWKYLDGNVRTEHGEVTHPEYREQWYRYIVNERGDELKERLPEGVPPPTPTPTP